MQIYEQTLTVTKHHLDLRNHVNNVQYVQWVQDIAETHWSLKTSEDIRSKYYWVIIDHHIQYKGEAKLNEILLLKTYVIQSEGVRSTRKVEIYNKESGKLLVTSETIWCFMSTETHRPTRILDHISTLFS